LSSFSFANHAKETKNHHGWRPWDLLAFAEGYYFKNCSCLTKHPGFIIHTDPGPTQPVDFPHTGLDSILSGALISSVVEEYDLVFCYMGIYIWETFVALHNISRSISFRHSWRSFTETRNLLLLFIKWSVLELVRTTIISAPVSHAQGFKWSKTTQSHSYGMTKMAGMWFYWQY
jgi:hypothetical protein